MGGGRVAKSQRDVSLWRLARMTEEDLYQFCVDTGYLLDRRGEACPKCERPGLVVKVRNNGDGLMYSCPNKTCRHQGSVTWRKPGFFLQEVPLRKQMLVQPGSQKLAQYTEMDELVAARLADNVRGCRLTCDQTD